MADRLPEHVLNDLRDARSSAALERASFEGVGKTKGMQVIVRIPYEDGEVHETVFDGSVTDFIRDRVRLHHGSWIIGPIDRILAWSQSTDDGSMNEYDILNRLRSKWPNPAVLEEAHKEISELRSRNAELEDFKRKTQAALKNLGEDA
jgi:hypothetical protein